MHVYNLVPLGFALAASAQKLKFSKQRANPPVSTYYA